MQKNFPLQVVVFLVCGVRVEGEKKKRRKIQFNEKLFALNRNQVSEGNEKENRAFAHRIEAELNNTNVQSSVK